MEQRNIKLLIEYDGTNYCGWQRQIKDPSIQEELEKAIYKLTREKTNVIGSGRTDSGVHATGQVANFYTVSKIPTYRFRQAINNVLPKDIAVLESQEVDMKFSACDDATSKEYRYIIYNNKTRSPIKRNFSYFVNYNLDRQAMKRSLEGFMGTHDFRGFMATGSSIKGTVRTITDLELVEQGDTIEIIIRGTGFLYNMVRIIVGTLLDVGRGKIDENSIRDIIDSKQRNRAGHTADACGLYLTKVFY